MRRTFFAAVFCATVASPIAATAQTTGGPVTLTLKDAEQMALRNHPRVLASQSDVAATREHVTEARSAYFPIVAGEVTGSTANSGARIGAGALSASALFDRFGQGLVVSQLITDSGRTPNLVASTRLQAQASEQNLQATEYDVLLAVNVAFFDVLRTQALVKVAKETVDARQLLLDQVSTLAQNGLRSQLDVNFAEVNVSDAKLLLLGAQNDLQSGYAQLARAIGAERPVDYQLVDEPMPANVPDDPSTLVTQAITNRPDLAKLRYERDAAYKFSAAENDLKRPIVSAVGTAGFLPYFDSGAPARPPDHYEGAAINVDVPIFNGGLFGARHAAAEFRAKEADQDLRDGEQGIARDVRVAWGNVTTAFQRLDVTAKFMQSATLALDLAQGRYNLGLSSIVELTQAQLNLTRAEVENLNARYTYQMAYATLQHAIGLLR